jgi:hypothetical protein
MGYWQDVLDNWQIKQWVKGSNGLVLGATFGYILVIRSFPGQAAFAYFALYVVALIIALVHKDLTGKSLLSLEGTRLREVGLQSITGFAAAAGVLVMALLTGLRWQNFPGPDLTAILVFGAIAETLAWPYIWARILPYGPILSSLFFAAAHPQTIEAWLRTGHVTPESLVFFVAAFFFNIFMVGLIALREYLDGPAKKLFGFFAASGVHFAINYGLALFAPLARPEEVFSIIFFIAPTLGGVLGFAAFAVGWRRWPEPYRFRRLLRTRRRSGSSLESFSSLLSSPESSPSLRPIRPQSASLTRTTTASTSARTQMPRRRT